MSGIELIARLAAGTMLLHFAFALHAPGTNVRNGAHSARLPRTVRNGALCPVAIPTGV